MKTYSADGAGGWESGRSEKLGAQSNNLPTCEADHDHDKVDPVNTEEPSNECSETNQNNDGNNLTEAEGNEHFALLRLVTAAHTQLSNDAGNDTSGSDPDGEGNTAHSVDGKTEETAANNGAHK